ncbi:MAG: hypothetical protein PUP91_10880 [Rhizonema sp. PD37]|nr:hypothetical protein [Rhizonema sp. PD37]
MSHENPALATRWEYTIGIYTMNAQDFLTLLFNAIAVSFIFIITFDFITFVSIAIQHQKPKAVSLSQFSIFEILPTKEPLCPIDMELIPDPWMLSTVEHRQNKPKHTKVKPQLLLASSTVELEQSTPVIATLEWLTETISPVKDENEQPPNVIEMAHSKSASLPIPETTALANNSLRLIDIEKLQLRPARKIAKELNIAQKVRGKDAPVSWLRSQIKERLKEQPTQTAKVISSVLQKAG